MPCRASQGRPEGAKDRRRPEASGRFGPWALRVAPARSFARLERLVVVQRLEHDHEAALPDVLAGLAFEVLDVLREAAQLGHSGRAAHERALRLRGVFGGLAKLARGALAFALVLAQDAHEEAAPRIDRRVGDGLGKLLGEERFDRVAILEIAFRAAA